MEGGPRKGVALFDGEHMKQLIAKKRLSYAGKSIASGAQFAATDGDARILTVIGFAVEQEVLPDVPKRRSYKRRDMRAEA